MCTAELLSQYKDIGKLYIKSFEEMTYSTRKHRDSVRGLIQVDPVLHREYHSNGPRGLSVS